MKKNRYKYTKEQKERILYEISLNKSIDEAFNSLEIDFEKLDISDEKYRAKLISKWKKDLYLNRENISILNVNTQILQLEKENNLNQFDDILEFYEKSTKA